MKSDGRSPLPAVANQDKRGPEVGIAVLVVAADEVELGGLDGCGAGLALFEVLIEGLHELTGAFVADGPEGGDDGFGSGALDLVAEAEDFFTVSGYSPFGGFTGAHDD